MDISELREINKKQLLDLGYSSDQIDAALSQTSNLDEAISILSPEGPEIGPDNEDIETHPGSDKEEDLLNVEEERGTLEEGADKFQSIEMDEVPGSEMSEDPPPYEEIAHLNPQLPSGLNAVPEEGSREQEGQEGAGEAFEFPVSYLYELEGRCFVDNWSIPYKRTESLGILLQASAQLALEGSPPG